MGIPPKKHISRYHHMGKIGDLRIGLPIGWHIGRDARDGPHVPGEMDWKY